VGTCVRNPDDAAPDCSSIASVTTPTAPIPIEVSVASAVRGRWWRSGWPPLLLALACAGAYAVFFALPYYVNDLDRFPLEEVAMGYHDPKDLWPHAQGGWASFRLAGMATFFLGPALALATLAWAVVRTRQGIVAGDLLRTAPALVAAAIAVGTLAWLFSPFGRALMSWFLD
jgi:hypothetical protein